MEHLLDARILDDFRECGVLLGRAVILVAVVAGELQEMRGAFGVAELRVGFRDEEIEQAGIGGGALLDDVPAACGRRRGIQGQGFLKVSIASGYCLFAK